MAPFAHLPPTGHRFRGNRPVRRVGSRRHALRPPPPTGWAIRNVAQRGARRVRGVSAVCPALGHGGWSAVRPSGVTAAGCLPGAQRRESRGVWRQSRRRFARLSVACPPPCSRHGGIVDGRWLHVGAAPLPSLRAVEGIAGAVHRTRPPFTALAHRPPLHLMGAPAYHPPARQHLACAHPHRPAEQWMQPLEGGAPCGR